MRRLRIRATRRKRRPGIVLVIVLVVVVVLSLAAYTFTDVMQANRRAAVVAGQQVQAKLLVDSGMDTVKLYLMSSEILRDEMGGHYDNPTYFQAAPVLAGLEPRDRGCFTILAPLLDDVTGQSSVRYGLENESARLNLNMLLIADASQSGAGRTLLMTLPYMTEDTADAILDWLDSDIEPREYGAEDDYYSGLLPPYAARNGVPTTVEELLLVRGVTPDLLFGFDVNRNGMQDANEMLGAPGSVVGMMGGTVSPTASTSISGGATGATDSTTFFRGWASYLTLYSAEGNVRPDGTARIFLNNTDLNALSEELLAVFDESYTNFILAYRLYGSANSQATGSQSGQGGAAPGSNQATGRTQVVEAEDLDLDLSQQPQGTFAQVLDLIGKQVQVPGANGVTQIVNSPFLDDPAEMADYLPLLMENCSVSEAPMVPGRININEAAPELLYGIPGISEELAAEIVVRRSELGVAYEPAYRHETWLLTEGLVTVDEMRALLPFVTARGSVFRAQIVGYYQGGGPSSRAEAVFDATETTPRLLFWRDLSHLGRGYPLDILGVDMVGTP